MHLVHSFEWPDHDLEFNNVRVFQRDDVDTIDVDVVHPTVELEHTLVALDDAARVAEIIVKHLAGCGKVGVTDGSTLLGGVHHGRPKHTIRVQEIPETRVVSALHHTQPALKSSHIHFHVKGSRQYLEEQGPP